MRTHLLAFLIAMPLLGQASRFLGGMTLFWEREAAP